MKESADAMIKRPDLAEKKRLFRARAQARRDLEIRGLVVYGVMDSLSDLIAFDRETGHARVVRVCLGKISRKDTEFMSKCGGIQFELWNRQPGKINFSITKL